MLQRVAAKGSLKNFNDATGENLLRLGFAEVTGEELLVTAEGISAAREYAKPQ